jgi:hypothetical protein
MRAAALRRATRENAFKRVILRGLDRRIPVTVVLTLLLCAGVLKAQNPAADVAASTKPALGEAPDYQYQATRARDPFVPLTGPGIMDTALYASDEEFNPEAMELKGLLRTPTGRLALLRSSGGNAYLVKDGKILNYKRKPVVGYVGIVKEKSLVMIGPNNQVTELKWKADDEERAVRP